MEVVNGQGRSNGALEVRGVCGAGRWGKSASGAVVVGCKMDVGERDF